MSSARASASRICALVKPGARAMSRMTFSRRATSSIGVGQPFHRIGGDDHRTMEIGMDDIAVAGQHAEDVHVAAHLNHMHVGVAGTDAAADDLETPAPACRNRGTTRW